MRYIVSFCHKAGATLQTTISWCLPDGWTVKTPRPLGDITTRHQTESEAWETYRAYHLPVAQGWAVPCDSGIDGVTADCADCGLPIIGQSGWECTCAPF